MPRLRRCARRGRRLGGLERGHGALERRRVDARGLGDRRRDRVLPRGLRGGRRLGLLHRLVCRRGRRADGNLLALHPRVEGAAVHVERRAGLQGEALHLAVYADKTIGFIAEQVGAHLGNWANFTKGSAKT